jgi:superfamily II DNA or RNA helicase/DNA-binding XRE family transcriptional regulator
MTPGEIKHIRKTVLQLSQQEFATKLGVSFSTVNRWEKGHAEPQPDRLRRLRALVGETQGQPTVQPHVLESTPPPVQLDFEGSAEAVKLVVDAYRLRNGHLFNRAFGLELSRVVPLPHQRIAVYEHLLREESLRFLLADDAGAGKTIMAGLYIREMINRGRLSRVLICCPAGLVFNWQRELRFFFELDFAILKGAQFKDQNPVAGSEQSLFVISVDTATSPNVQEKLCSESTPPFELVIFDEAHKLSWIDRDRPPTLRYQFADKIARLSPNLLLLTATPHMGNRFAYFALWRLLNPSIFSTYEAMQALGPAKRERHFIRRLKEEMVDYEGQPIYKPRLTQTVIFPLTVEERAFYDGATRYLRWSFENNRSLNKNAAAMVVAVLQRRLASSTFALMESLRRIREKRVDALQSALPYHPEPGLWDELIDDLDCATPEEHDPMGEGPEGDERAEGRLLQIVRPADPKRLREEIELIDQVLELGGKVREDAKFTKLRELLESPEYHREKLLLFTEHRDTLRYLQRQFMQLGYTNIAVIHGGVDAAEREVQRNFFMPPDTRRKLGVPNPDGPTANLMLATDAAGEGINLQFAWIMINYDIPWNPARLEQRMGRLHRFGQQHADVRIFNFVADKTREGDVLLTLLRKLEEARRDLCTDKVFDVVGQQLQDIKIRDLLLESLTEPESDGWRKKLEARLATKELRTAIEKLREQSSKYGDVGKRIGQLKAEIEAEDFTHLLPAYVQNFVEKAAPHLGLKLDGDLTTAARVTYDASSSRWLDRVLARLPNGLPDYLSVRRDFSLGDVLASKVAFLRPGDPFFEAICDEVSERFARDVARGALLCDPTSETPYGVGVYVCQVGELETSAARGSQARLERRLIAIKWDEEGRFDVCAPNHLLALHAVGLAGLHKAGRLLYQPDEQIARADQYAKSVAEATVLNQIRVVARAEVESRLGDIARGFDFRSAELAERRAELSRKLREAGENPKTRIELDHVKADQGRLTEERAAALLREQRRVDLLDIVQFQRIAIGLVLPDPSPEAKEVYDKNIEAIAVRVARNFEVDRFRARVLDVSSPALARGYDLESYRPDKPPICIEVKGRAGRGSVQLTENEWPTAANVRDRYWLYVVVDCATNPVLYRVQDPAFKLAVKSRQSFSINFGDIVQEAEPD